MEVEEIGSQPQSTETSDSSRYSSFLGTSYGNETEPEDTAPSGEESADEEVAQTEDGSEPETTEEVEAASPQLPAWLDDFNPEDVAKFKARYPSAFARLSNPATSADDQFLLRDKMNDFLEIQRLRAPQETGDEEPTLEDNQNATSAQQPTAEQRQAYYQQIESIVTNQLDKGSLEEWGRQSLEAMGIDVKSEDPEIQAIVKNAGKMAAVNARGVIDLVATILPSLLPSRLESVMPGLQEWHTGRMLESAWEGVRSQKEANGTQPYADLPALNTPEWNEAIDKVLVSMPELRTMFSELPPQQRFAAQYKVAARLMTGQKLSPADAAQTAEAAKRKAQKQDSKLKAGKALGAGKPRGNASAPGSGNSIMANYNSRHGNVFSKR